MGIICLLILSRHYRDVLNQSIFVVADFGRNNKTVSRLDKDVVAPYVHVLPSYTQDDSVDPFSARKTLLFFQGRVRRKSVSPIIMCYWDLIDFIYSMSLPLDKHRFFSRMNTWTSVGSQMQYFTVWKWACGSFFQDGIIRAKLGELLMNETDVQYVDSLASSTALTTVRVVSFLYSSFNYMFQYFYSRKWTHFLYMKHLFTSCRPDHLSCFALSSIMWRERHIR